MNLDDDICYCYHVSLRKLVNFAKRTRPRRPAQMTECLGAGTGCGWCIPILTKLADSHGELPASALALSPEEYAAARESYRRERRERNRFVDDPPG